MSEDLNNNEISDKPKHDPGIAWTPAKGFRDGFPICLGYFACAFSIGIAAGSVGFNAVQGFILSLTNLSSSGEYAGILLFSENSGYLQLALMILVANARYLLMSCAISQKFSPRAALTERLIIAFGLTDELFGLGIMTPGYLRPKYMYAALITAATGWALGTSAGIIAGDILPGIFSEAINVAIFGMFIAIIIPPGKHDRHVLIAVIISFAAGLIGAYAPLISTLSSGTRVLILTVIIASVIAILFPVPDSSSPTDKENEKGAQVQ